MSTIKDLSAITGLSLGTISNYLNGRKIQQKNSEKIEKAIEETNYFSNSLGRYLKSGNTKTVGIVANDISAPYISQSIAIIQEEISKKGYNIFFCNCNNNVLREKENIDFLLSHAVNAIISFPVSHIRSDFQNALKIHRPLILCDGAPSDPDVACHSVSYDNERLAFEATQTLIREGHRHISCIAGRNDHYSTITRVSGYLRALVENGIEINQNLIFYCDFNNSLSLKATEKIISEHSEVTACLITVNNMLIGFLMGTANHRLSYITFSREDYYDLLPEKPTYILHDTKSLGVNTLKILEKILFSKTDEPLSPISKIAKSKIVLGDSHKK